MIHSNTVSNKKDSHLHMQISQLAMLTKKEMLLKLLVHPLTLGLKTHNILFCRFITLCLEGHFLPLSAGNQELLITLSGKPKVEL